MCIGLFIRWAMACSVHVWLPPLNGKLNECICFIAFARVLKPPGGGSSDIFGAANGPSTPSVGSTSAGQRVAPRNHQTSNIFGAPQSKNGKCGNATIAASIGINRVYYPYGIVSQTTCKEPIDTFSSVFMSDQYLHQTYAFVHVFMSINIAFKNCLLDSLHVFCARFKFVFFGFTFHLRVHTHQRLFSRTKNHRFARTRFGHD